ncbi:MAG: hypothetical protein OXN17_08200 [Candidatus Poribacteria bacterium]|nr:hypothetical protein [Candidatus Poribacteria bacterium]MDE0505332.1 hypothetical protein [Candidatus Poribacteria bacterium]
MKTRHWSYIALCVLLCVVGVIVLSGSAPDDPVVSDQLPVTGEEPSDYDVPLPDKSYFRIEHRGDVHEPNRWLVKFQVPPPDWPGAVQATMHTMLVLRGVDVPTSLVDWDKPYWQVNRQRTRNAAAESFVWEILSRTEMLWAENPEETEDGTAALVDVNYKRGDATVSMADAMVEMGHAKPATDGGAYDWGKP